MKKQKITKKKMTIIFIIIACICAIVYFVGYKYIYLNRPSEISKELQKVITEEMGEEYRLMYPRQEETHIDSVSIDVKSELYEDENIFRNCDKLKDVVYQFVKAHPKKFDLIPLKDKKENIGDVDGFRLYVADTKGDKLYGGSNSVFVFGNCLIKDDKYVDGFYYLSVGAKGLSSYGYKLSDFTAIKGIQELSIEEVEIDDVDALAEMEDLESIYWDGDKSIGVMLHKAAIKYSKRFVQG